MMITPSDKIEEILLIYAVRPNVHVSIIKYQTPRGAVTRITYCITCGMTSHTMVYMVVLSDVLHLRI